MPPTCWQHESTSDEDELRKSCKNDFSSKFLSKISIELFSGAGKSHHCPPRERGPYWKGALSWINFSGIPFRALTESSGKSQGPLTEKHCYWIILASITLGEDTVSKCFVYQDSGHTQTPRICHIFVLSLLVSGSTLPRNAYFSRQTLNCHIFPVLPSYRGGGLPGEERQKSISCPSQTHIENSGAIDFRFIADFSFKSIAREESILGKPIFPLYWRGRPLNAKKIWGNDLGVMT